MTELIHPPDHLEAAGSSAIGRRRLIQAAGATAGAAALAPMLSAGSVEAAVEAGSSRFVALPKGIRLMDTRYRASYVFDPDVPNSRNSFTRVAPNHVRVQVRDRHGVPADASAVVVTIAGVMLEGKGFITAFPTGKKLPTAANLNLTRPGERATNLCFVKVGSDDSIDIFQKVPTHVVVDILGYFEPVSTPQRGGRFIALNPARRALDTRDRPNQFAAAKSFTEVDLTGIVPAGASAFINLTGVDNQAPGFFTAVPYSVRTTPTTSSLNIVYPGERRGATAIVPVETAGGRQKIKIYSHVAAKLVVDVAGYFTAENASQSDQGLFIPTDPIRVLDTREKSPPMRMWPRWVVEQTLPSPADKSAAVVVNLTSTATRSSGFLSMDGARLRNIALPITTSNVNWMWPNSTVPNLAISRVTADYGFEVYNHTGGHVVADMAGYFTGLQQIRRYYPWSNPPPPPAPPEWILRVPKLGLTSRVLEGNSIVITDSGHSWHWTGTGDMGQSAHVGVFAHRTEHGGPYRYIHLLQPGDTWTVTTLDGREFTYRMVRRDLTNSWTPNILNATRLHPGTTFSLIACSRTDFLPTSLSWRIIVTGELVSWREV